ncbi:MAG: phenylacetate--CoA ligase [Acidimicrobiales bacterium]|nr:phenylacetate--CoA ligase [Acidimicrobiales bacterium]
MIRGVSEVSTGFHQPDIELMPREQLETIQLQRLQTTVRRLRENVPLMTERLSEVGDPSQLDDLAEMPFLYKSDLRDTYPFGLFAAGRRELARIHASSGTSGKPTVVGYTTDDIAVWNDCVARCLRGAGVEPGWWLHNAYGYGLFTGGLGLHGGAESAGIGVIPVSGGNTERQLTLIQDFQPEAICCTPSYALTLADRLHSLGVESNSLRVGILGAEPWTEEMRQSIEQRLNIIAVNIYGLSEVIGPGVSCETADRDGLVIMEDHFLPEVVDPETGERLPDGEIGVLVLTSLTKQAFPVLRYWTGDLCSITREPAPCGRTHARMSGIVGRADDMLVIRGVNVYPSQVEHTLLSVEGVSPHFQLVVRREGTLDTLSIRCEQEGSAGDATALADAVTVAMQSSLGIGVSVTVEAPGALPRSEGGKLSRVADERNL